MSRDRGAALWHALIREDYGGDSFRDFVDGSPVSCGASLELQDIEWRSDDDGDYRIALATGARVRYEIEWTPTKRPVLYAVVAGYDFVGEVKPWMRFRWPERRR